MPESASPRYRPKFVLASEEECIRLLDRRFDDLRMLVIYVDGIVVADHSIIAAVGIDSNGYKHVLGIADFCDLQRCGSQRPSLWNGGARDKAWGQEVER